MVIKRHGKHDAVGKRNLCGLVEAKSGTTTKKK